MRQDFESIYCAVCGVDDIELISRKGYLDIPIYVSICINCGLVYLNPRWNKERYNYYYTHEYAKYDEWSLDKTESKKKQKKKSKREKVFERISKYIHKNSISILDIGAGNGKYLEYLIKRYPDSSLSAIEPSPLCKDYLTNTVGAELIAEDVDFDWHVDNRGRFDLVIMRMILEYLLDPLSVLHKVSYVLSGDGILYIAVPNMMAPKLKGSLNDYWFRVSHTFYFSEPTLLALVGQGNLKPLFVDSTSHEIWGIFTKGRFNYKLESVYKEQKKVIEKAKIRYLTKSLTSFIRRLFKSFLKEKLK